MPEEGETPTVSVEREANEGEFYLAAQFDEETLYGCPFS